MLWEMCWNVHVRIIDASRVPSTIIHMQYYKTPFPCLHGLWSSRTYNDMHANPPFKAVTGRHVCFMCDVMESTLHKHREGTRSGYYPHPPLYAHQCTLHNICIKLLGLNFRIQNRGKRIPLSLSHNVLTKYQLNLGIYLAPAPCPPSLT